MARNEHPAEGVSYRACCWGDEWRGTAEQLITAGIIDRHLLPGEPGNNKTSATYLDGKPVRGGANYKSHESYLHIARSGRFFEVTKGISGKERARREAEEEAQYEQTRKEIEKQQKTAKNREYCADEIGRLIGTGEEYKARICTHVDVVLNLASGYQGYRFSSSAFKKINDHLSAIYALIYADPVVFDPHARAEAVGRIYEMHELEPPKQERKAPELRLVR